MRINLILLTCVFFLSISAFQVSAHSIGCGIVTGKAVKLPRPKRPSNLTGTVEVKVEIDENGNVYSAESLSPDSELRQRSLEKAVQAKFAPITISGAPVFDERIIQYVFKLEKSKAEINIDSSISKIYERLLTSKIACGQLWYEVVEYIKKKTRSEITGEQIDVKKVQAIWVSTENSSLKIDELNKFGFNVISDDINYFGGIYGEVAVDKILDLAELDSTKIILSLDNLDYCENKLVQASVFQQCAEFKSLGPFTRFFYGNQTDKIISPKNTLPESLKANDKKVFVQIKFDADGNILEAKSVSGNTELFEEAESFVRQVKLEPQQINRDLKYAVGLIVYDSNLFR